MVKNKRNDWNIKNMIGLKSNYKKNGYKGIKNRIKYNNIKKITKKLYIKLYILL